jgi:RNA polymerase sigma-70 factor (ECF subfamily)
VQSNQAVVTQSTNAPPPFRELFEAEFGYVARTLRYLGVRGSEIEDVTHDVFLHVYRHLAEFDPTRPVKPWLFGFAYRIARDFRALARHHRESAWEPQELRDSAPLADELLVQSQALVQALKALDSLEPEERAVFIAHELDELPMPDVAEALAIPLNTAYSRLRRARSKFEAAARRMATQERIR